MTAQKKSCVTVVIKGVSHAGLQKSGSKEGFFFFSLSVTHAHTRTYVNGRGYCSLYDIRLALMSLCTWRKLQRTEGEGLMGVSCNSLIFVFLSMFSARVHNMKGYYSV